jgi:alkylation response protein AidB-like acyl-CoA dehydrogenase
MTAPASRTAASLLIPTSAPFSAKASMAICFASDMAMKVTTDAVQIFGGAGYMNDCRSTG